MTDKLFDLDDIRDPSGDADIKRGREIFARVLQVGIPSEDTEGPTPEAVERTQALARDILKSTEGVPCGRCGHPIRDYFYLEIVSEEPRKEVMVCSLCYRGGKRYAQEEPDGQ